MNKRRLLLFSIFALLHITTSERNFIDGRYECCNHSLRLSSETNFLTHDTNRQRFVPVIRQINNSEKNPNFNLRDTKNGQLSTRRQVEYGETQFRDTETRGLIDKRRNRILINPTNERQGREDFKERSYERRNVLPNESRRNRFAEIRDREHTREVQTNTLSRYDNRKYDSARNCFESKDVSRRSYNNRNQYARGTYAIRNEGKIFSGKDKRQPHLENVIREQTNLRPIVAMTSERQNVVDILAERKVRHRMNRNLEEELSETESVRRHLVRETDRRSDRDNFRKNRRSVSDNTRRSFLRGTDSQNSLIEMQKKSADLRFRLNNVLRRSSSQEYETQLRETNRSRKNVANENDRAMKTDNSRRVNFNKFDDNRERNNRLVSRRNSLGEIYTSQDVRNDARIQFDRRNVNYDARYNRGTHERETSVRRYRINNTSRYVEMIKRDNRFESRHSEKNVLSESNDIRDIKGNTFSARSNLIDQTLEKDTKRTIQRNLPTGEFRAREELRKYTSIQNRNNEATDKVIRRHREVFGLSPEVRKRDENRHSSRDSRYMRFINNDFITDREDRQRSDNRLEINDDRIRNRNVQRRVDNESSWTTRQKNEINISSRTDRDISVRRGIQITIVGDNFRQRTSRSMNDISRATNKRYDIRKLNNERNARKTRKERIIDAQRIATVVNGRRNSATELSDIKTSIMSHEIQYDTNIFEIKWQYVFYALQMIYLCSFFMKIPKDEAEKKHKIRMADWFTSAEYLKVD